MPGDGPFLWLSDKGSEQGFWHLPPGGMCLSAFLFVTRGDQLLLGKYADHPRWEQLAGLGQDRRRAHGQGWTLPASHLTFGEDPREAGARIASEILGLDGLELSEPRVETEVAVPERFPELGEHYDVWFFMEASLPEGTVVDVPPWYTDVAWHDPRRLQAEAYARSHEDVVSRWLKAPRPPPRSPAEP